MTKEFSNVSKTCVENIRHIWGAIRRMAATDSGLNSLTKQFNACTPLKTKDIETFVNYIYLIFLILSMSNSPLPRNIIKPLPGYPISKFCSHLSETISDDNILISHLAKAVNAYENYTQEFKCLDLYFKDEFLGQSTMSFLGCSRVGDGLCSNGIDDMFEVFKPNKSKIIEDCKKRYKIIPDSKDVKLEFGDRNSIRFSSNIIFRYYLRRSNFFVTIF